MDAAAITRSVGEHGQYGYLIHDRDRIHSRHLDASIEAPGLRALRSPLAAPKANAICERVIGTIRRECLDWMIPLSVVPLRAILREWVTHYDAGRVHSKLGPGFPIRRGQRGTNEIGIPSSVGGKRARPLEIDLERITS